MVGQILLADEEKENFEKPILHSGEDTWAPSGAEFYHGDEIPHWTGKYFVATLRGSHLHMIEFDLQNNSITSHEKLFQDEFGRLRDVQTGPDGFLYILTSNQDGRGTPKTNDDKILKIIPLDYTTTSKDEIIIDPNPIDFREPRAYVGEIYAYAGLGLVGIVLGFIIIKKIKNREKK